MTTTNRRRIYRIPHAHILNFLRKAGIRKLAGKISEKDRQAAVVLPMPLNVPEGATVFVCGPKPMIKAGMDVNAAQPDGMTALHWAAQRGDVSSASVLVAAGARVDVGEHVVDVGGGRVARDLLAQQPLGALETVVADAGRSGGAIV